MSGAPPRGELAAAPTGRLMRLPRIFRTTPFRLTLLFLALFASVRRQKF